MKNKIRKFFDKVVSLSVSQKIIKYKIMFKCKQ